MTALHAKPELQRRRIFRKIEPAAGNVGVETYFHVITEPGLDH